MRTRLVPYGREHALVLSQDLLNELDLAFDATFDIITDGQRIIITPVDDAERRAAFQAALEETDRLYGDVLKRLADS